MKNNEDELPIKGNPSDDSSESEQKTEKDTIEPSKVFHESKIDKETRSAIDKRMNKGGGLEYGPLIKSKYTYDLESLFTEIISNKNNVKIDITKDPLAYKATVMDKEGNIIKVHDLSKILKFANLNHITLTPECYKLYENYAKKQNGKEVKLKEGEEPAPPTDHDTYPDRDYPSNAYFEAQDKDGHLKDLTYAEKLAIHIYTSNFYKDINAVLRGEISSYYAQAGYCSEDEEWRVKDALIHSIMATAGLNNVASIHDIGHDVDTYRTEKLHPGISLTERLSKAEGDTRNSVTTEKGFVSASTKKIYSGGSIGGGSIGDGEYYKIKTTFAGSIGAYIAPISCHPEETEFLMPPGTQFSWRASEKIRHRKRWGGALKKDKPHNSNYYFIVKAVRTLTGLTPEECEAPTLMDINLYTQSELAQAMTQTLCRSFQKLENSSPERKQYLEQFEMFIKKNAKALNAIATDTATSTKAIIKQFLDVMQPYERKELLDIFDKPSEQGVRDWLMQNGADVNALPKQTPTPALLHMGPKKPPPPPPGGPSTTRKGPPPPPKR